MDIIFKNMRGIIAMVIVLGTFVFDYFLFFQGIPSDNKELTYTAAGGLNTMTAQICSYFFGSSKDKSDQEKATITAEVKKIANEQQPGDIPPNGDKD